METNKYEEMRRNIVRDSDEGRKRLREEEEAQRQERQGAKKPALEKAPEADQ